MKTGMMWYSNDGNKSLQVKIQEAVDYYFKKYGRNPDLVLVHPSMMDKSEEGLKIVVRPYRPVLPGHIWVGIEDEK